jgi:aspartyl/glutamyl-tRNA(Asn/Gln) amidotransferase C subunit
MSVDRSHAAGIAALARLRFDGEELDRITQEMNQVLEYVEELKSLEVDDMPSEGPDPLEGEGDATRGPGAESPDALRSELGQMAPDARDGFFVVPPLPGVHAEEAQ